MENLTFGVELEFLTFRPQGKLAAEEYIATYLLAPITLPCNKPGCTQGVHQWRLPIREPGKGYRTSTYTLWNVTNDISVSSDMETELIVIGKSAERPIEIQSRIMNFEGTTPCPRGQSYPCTGEPLEWQWRDEIAAVVDAITRAYSRPGFRACVNESAGMHVHLGNGTSPMPVEVVKGITGTFTALERQIDRILPASRIYGYEGGFCLPGVDTTNHAGRFDENNGGRFPYCKGMANVMLKHYEIALIDELKTTPDKQSEARIEEAVKSINVPAWLELIQQQESNQALSGLWMYRRYAYADGHESAVNLENLDREKGTVEIRVHQATLDVQEITAWVDLMGKTALWTASARDVFIYLQAGWANPDHTLIDFAKHVGADSFTVSHYEAKTDPNFAKERYNHLVAAPNNPVDELHALTRAIEFNRYIDLHPDSVMDKIWWKMISGRYGQFNTRCIDSAFPHILNTKLGTYLNIDTCDWDSWIDHSTSEHRRTLTETIEVREKTLAQAQAQTQASNNGGRFGVDYPSDESPSSGSGGSTETNTTKTTTTKSGGRFGVNYPSDESPSSGDGENTSSPASGSGSVTFSFGNNDDAVFEIAKESSSLMPEGTLLPQPRPLVIMYPDPESAEAEEETAVGDVTASFIPGASESTADRDDISLVKLNELLKDPKM